MQTIQVLGKSVKPIPVMILGILLAKKRYPAAKFIFILMICMGVAAFMYKDKTPTDEDHSFGFGEVLLVSIILSYSLFKVKTCYNVMASALFCVQ